MHRGSACLRVYLTVEEVESKGGSSPLSSRSRVSDNSSLLGVRAEKDLGRGLKGWGPARDRVQGGRHHQRHE